MQLKLSASIIFTILVLAVTGGEARNINRATGASPAIVGRAPNPAPPTVERSISPGDPPGLGRRHDHEHHSLKGELFHEGAKAVVEGLGNVQGRSAEGIVDSPGLRRRKLRSGVLLDRSVNEELIAERSISPVDSPGLGRRHDHEHHSLKGELFHEGAKAVVEGLGNVQGRSAEGIVDSPGLRRRELRSGVLLDRSVKEEILHEGMKAVAEGAGNLQSRSAEDSSLSTYLKRRSWKAFKNFFKHDLGKDLKEGLEIGASIIKHIRSEYPAETEC